MNPKTKQKTFRFNRNYYKKNNKIPYNNPKNNQFPKIQNIAHAYTHTHTRTRTSPEQRNKNIVTVPAALLRKRKKYYPKPRRWRRDRADYGRWDRPKTPALA
jgi:hypothetical protein